MPGYGFVRDEIEIKTLTLFSLKCAGVPVSFEQLMKIVFVDDAIDYFDYTTYLAQMVKSEHVSVNSDTGSDRYSITKKGIRDLAAIQTSVPRSVLRKSEKIAAEVKEEISRSECITVNVTEKEDRFIASGVLKDNNGEIFSFSTIAATKKSAQSITSSFYKNAERIYNDFLKSISDTSK